MEKPNPDNYNSTGFYLYDLEKYNQMIPQEIIDKIDAAAELEEIYEPKYGGKDHSGYDTMMKYEINSERSECFEKGAIFGYSLRDDEVAELKNELLELKEIGVTESDCAEKLEALEDRLFSLGEMNKPPCFCCGYNGEGYYQPKTHPYCAERHHKLFKHQQAEGLVWDYSDIAIKFKNWFPVKEFENENAAFTFFFQEVYNKDFR